MANRTVVGGAASVPATQPREQAGTPKVIEQARERLEDAAKESADLLKKSGQDATGELLQTLVRLSDAAARSQTAIRAAIKMLPNNSDADSSLAVMELADAAGLELCRDAWSAGGLAMVIVDTDKPPKAQASQISEAAAKARDKALIQASCEIAGLAQSLGVSRTSRDVHFFDAILPNALNRIYLLGTCVGVLGDPRADEETIGEQYEIVMGEKLEGLSHE